MRYCLWQDHPALWMEMRLGKTLVATRRIVQYHPQGKQLNVLVVAPGSALGSWERDLQADGHGDAVLYIEGKTDERRRLLGRRAPWKLVNREAHLHIPELAQVRWDAVVIDESTSIKNPRTQISKFHLRNFRNVPHRWSLTGTPNPQNDLEFWPQMAWLDGKAFGCRTFWDFRARYFDKPPWGYDWVPKIGVVTMMRKEVARRCFVMTRADAGMDVPKVLERRTFPMPASLRKVYRTLEEDLILEYMGKEVKRTKQAPVKLTWLRQLCGGFVDGELKWKGKLYEMSSLLEGELANDQVVVWFNYAQEIDAAYDHLRKRGVSCKWLDGRITNKAKRREMETDFLASRFRVLLIQVKIGEMGMDLSSADTAMYYSPPYGTLARSQSEDRILAVHKKGPLLILDLCVEDSVDTALLDTLQQHAYGVQWNLHRVMLLMAKQREGRAA